MNNKRKEFHKKDLDIKYHYLCSVNFPFTEWLYGDDLNKNVKEIQDMNKLSRNVGLGTSQRGAMVMVELGGDTWGIQLVLEAITSVDHTNTSSGSKNSKAGPKKQN